MDDLSRKLEAAREHIAAVDFDDGHAALVLVQMRRRARRRAITRTAGAIAGVLAALLIGFTLASAPDPKASEIRLADGTILDPARGAEVGVEDVTAHAVAVKLVRGYTRFDVARRPERTFVVRSGDVRVVVIGTIFSVDRAGDRTIVAVERGRVRVEWPNGSTDLGDGESGSFPPERPAELTVAPPEPQPTLAPEPRVESSSEARGEPKELYARPRTAPIRAPTPSEVGPGPERLERTPAPPPEPVAETPPIPAAEPKAEWRALAERGEYREAYDAMTPAKAETVRDEPAELLAAADVARLSGHAEEAIPFLERILGDHGRDPRAPLAAFTLGRILLDLDRASDAAPAFARARRLDPTGTLAEDALAREVEAWSKAGEREKARARAIEYRAFYPEGDRVEIRE
jgi:transmembrane sensor